LKFLETWDAGCVVRNPALPAPTLLREQAELLQEPGSAALVRVKKRRKKKKGKIRE